MESQEVDASARNPFAFCSINVRSCQRHVYVLLYRQGQVCRARQMQGH